MVLLSERGDKGEEGEAGDTLRGDKLLDLGFLIIRPSLYVYGGEDILAYLDESWGES